MKRKQKPSPAVCPVCGEDVPPRSLACPECGACHNSGWKEDAHQTDGLNLPDDDFDYDEFVRDEFGGRAKPRGMNVIWWVMGIVLFLLFFLGAILGGGR